MQGVRGLVRRIDDAPEERGMRTVPHPLVREGQLRLGDDAVTPCSNCGSTEEPTPELEQMPDGSIGAGIDWICPACGHKEDA
jgi:hypothetical protein